MDSSPSPSRASALLPLAGALLGYASVPIFIRHFSNTIDPWTLNGVRYGTAALFWFPYVLLAWREIPAGRSILRDAAVPALVNAGAQVFWCLLFYELSAPVGSFGARISFLFTILYAFLVLPDERSVLRQRAFWLGTLLSLGGLGVMAAVSLKEGDSGSLRGWIFLLLQAAFAGGYGVFVRRFMDGYSARMSFGVICLYTAAILAVLMAVLGDAALPVLDLPAGQAGLLLLSALVGIALSHVLLYRAISGIGALAVSGSMLLTPFATSIGALFIRGERMGPAQWGGGLVLVTGCWLLLAARRRVDAEAGAQPPV